MVKQIDLFSVLKSSFFLICFDFYSKVVHVAEYVHDDHYFKIFLKILRLMSLKTYLSDNKYKINRTFIMK